MAWFFQSARETFDRHRDIWDEINQSHGNHLLLDSTFVRPLVRYFASANTLLGISNDFSRPGVVLLDKVRNGFWQTFQPSQAPLGLILLGNRDSVAEQMAALIRSVPGHALGLAALQQDTDYTVFQNLNPCQKIETLEYIKISRLTLIGTFDDYWKNRGKNTVHTLSRQRRRLTEKGVELSLVADRNAGSVAHGIREFGRLESMGWKGKAGTAVTAGGRQGLFYQEMLETFCSRGEGVIYRLLMNGETIASNLCLLRDRTMIILKTTYDESIKGISPGMLLHQELFKALFRDGNIKVVEFYGRVRDWHLKWTNEVRTMYHLNFYRYDWVAGARSFLKAFYEPVHTEEK
jgi:hypothetical protein